MSECNNSNCNICAILYSYTNVVTIVVTIQICGDKLMLVFCERL